MIVHKYLVREVTKPLVAVVVLLVGIFMAYSLTRFLADANEGALSASAVSTLTGLKVLIALEVLIPIALYVGMIVTLGRLYSDFEITALKAGGVGEGRIVAPVVWLSLTVAVVVGLLSLFGPPMGLRVALRVSRRRRGIRGTRRHRTRTVPPVRRRRPHGVSRSEGCRNRGIRRPVRALPRRVRAGGDFRNPGTARGIRETGCAPAGTRQCRRLPADRRRPGPDRPVRHLFHLDTHADAGPGRLPAESDPDRGAPAVEQVRRPGGTAVAAFDFGIDRTAGR